MEMLIFIVEGNVMDKIQSVEDFKDFLKRMGYKKIEILCYDSICCKTK